MMEGAWTRPKFGCRSCAGLFPVRDRPSIISGGIVSGMEVLVGVIQ